MAEKKKKLKKIKLQKAKFSDSERKQRFLKKAAWQRAHDSKSAVP